MTAWDDEQPSGGRIAIGLLAAAFAPVTAFVLWMAIQGAFTLGGAALFYLVGVPIAFAFVLLLGLPVYLVLRRRWRLTWWNAVLGGWAVATAPIAMFGLRSIGDPTFLLWVGQVGLLGVAGGLAFWAVVREARRPRIDPETFR